MMGSIGAFALATILNVNAAPAPKVATVHVISCEISELSYDLIKEESEEDFRQYYTLKQPTLVEFAVENLFSTKKSEPTGLTLIDPKNEEEPIRAVNPGEKGKRTAMSCFNDQGGDLRVSDDGKKIVLVGDADGVVFAKLTLYENTKFTAGVLIVTDSAAPGTFNWADKSVACKVKERK